MTYPAPFNYFGGATILQGDPSYFYYNSTTDHMHYSRPPAPTPETYLGWPVAEGYQRQTITFDQDWALNISMSYFPGPGDTFDARLKVDGNVIYEHTYSPQGEDWGGSVAHIFPAGSHTIEFYFYSPGGGGYTYGGFEIEIGISDYSILALHPTVSSLPNPIDSGQTSRVTIHVEADALGPTSDVDLNISTLDGNIDKTVTLTDAIGESKLLYTAPIVTSQMTDTINVTASKIGYIEGTGSNQITINPTLLSNLIPTISECPNQMNSNDNSEIKVHVIDNNNAPINGATVEVSAIGGGSFNISSGTTDTNGNIKFIYAAPIVTVSQINIISAVASKSDFVGISSSFINIIINP